MKIIGAMSGSSLDGLDLAMCNFHQKDGTMQWELLESKTFPFTEGIAKQLSQVPELSSKALEDLAIDLANFTAHSVTKLNGWDTCDAVAIHGHTILHEPEKGYSLQITNPWHLHKALRKTVVADFRNADIALGGQGAPLVPKADMDLFSGFDAFLNLGGIANATYFKNGEVLAYDLFACNQWINALSQQLGEPYDADGKLSGIGKPIDEIVGACMGWDFCSLPAPKSLSNASCQDFYKQKILPFLNHYSVSDVMRSCIVAMAKVIAASLKDCDRVLVTGGGAYNSTLMKELEQRIHLEIPNSDIVEFKEAIAFAYLGYCRINGLPGNVPNATGASREALLGCLYNF